MKGFYPYLAVCSVGQSHPTAAPLCVKNSKRVSISTLMLAVARRMRCAISFVSPSSNERPQKEATIACACASSLKEQLKE